MKKEIWKKKPELWKKIESILSQMHVSYESKSGEHLSGHEAETDYARQLLLQNNSSHNA